MNRELPQSIEAEAAVLGEMIINNRDAIGDVMNTLRGASDFHQQKHATICEALYELYERGSGIDIVTCKDALADRGVLDQVGGVAYLVQLAESSPATGNVTHYARIVRDKAIMRDVIAAAGKTLDEMYGEGGAVEVDSALDEIEQRFYAIRDAADTGLDPNAESFAALLQREYDRVTSSDGGDKGIMTGFADLDWKLNGLHPGQMVVIAARPSMGKSALTTNILQHVALREQKAVALFSLEMSREEVGQRMMCSVGGVDFTKMRHNQLTDADAHNLARAVGELGDAPIVVDDQGGLSLTQLRARARRMVARHKTQVVFVDYLQLMIGGKGRGQRREEEVSEISRGIKALARELRVPVVCLSQLNRNTESREDRRPRLSDLRESGSIEQDADVVLLLHREDYYTRNDDGHVPTNIADLDVAKQRNGPTGKVELLWDGSLMSFRNLEQFASRRAS